MAALAQQGKVDPAVRLQALKLTGNLRAKDYEAEARAVYFFVRDRVRYVRDIAGVETLHTAREVLARRNGDCDDKAILLAAMLASIGAQCRFVAVALGSRENWAHVWVQVYIPRLTGGEWLDLEATEAVRFGEPAPIRGVVDRIVYPV